MSIGVYRGVRFIVQASRLKLWHLEFTGLALWIRWLYGSRIQGRRIWMLYLLIAWSCKNLATLDVADAGFRVPVLGMQFSIRRG